MNRTMPVDERIARSVALEQAYVHDVYEEFSDNYVGKPWPKVQQFLENLEAGSLICDVGKLIYTNLMNKHETVITERLVNRLFRQ